MEPDVMMVLSGVDLYSKDSVERLFAIFKRDFIDTPLYLSDGNRSYRIDVKKENVCPCPFGNEHKPERFWHIITKEENDKKKRVNPCPDPENRRSYDAARAKRIHWIKPLIDNWLSDPDVVYFYERVRGKNTLHIWHRKQDFIVIIRKESNCNDRFLVTTYLVHRNERQRYRKRWKRYEESKPNSLEWF